MENPKLTKLKEMMTILNDGLSKAEFTNAFKSVLDFVKKAIGNLDQKYNETVKNLNDKVDTKLAQVKDGAKGDKGDQGEKGKDGKVFIGLHGKNGRDGAVGPQGPPGSPDTPIEVRDKLETLQNDERLDWKAVKDVIGIHIGTSPPDDKEMFWIDTR